MNGAGKYARQANLVLNVLDADVVLLVVEGGRVGSGFSVTCRSPSSLIRLRRLLTEIADDVEAQIARLPEPG